MTTSTARPEQEQLLKALLDRYGKTYAEELGIEVADNTPAPLFQALCLALLFSARISADLAMRAMRALLDEGWTTAANMASSSWEDRVETLNQAGYARFDEKTSTMLGEACELLLDRYQGDLRQLREQAGREPDEERTLLKQVKGIGDVGVDIFFREAQAAWDELIPFADSKALEGAAQLHLPEEPGQLYSLVGHRDFPRLVTALVRVQLEGDAEEIITEARGRPGTA
ncbi:MAG: hypothetical protein RQ741_08795 [Wenzhouxiangellaceae bacterium]|nr:hypothetical protein [Wenzhouxiangellaceae bacterium]